MKSLQASWQRFQGSKVAMLAFFATLVVVGTTSGYLQGRWSWQSVPSVPTQKQLQKLRGSGLTLPGWQTLEQQVVQLGDGKWSVQVLQRGEASAVLMLLPQMDKNAKPQVEWTDINGAYQWQTDSFGRLKFTVTEPTTGAEAAVTARIFRGWTQQQTYAVVQWYAWPTGGHPEVSHWFWADRAAQVRGDFGAPAAARRQGWVAVNLLLPMEPLADLEPSKASAQALAEQVQAQLMAGPLASGSRR